ncbi:hypothetical protein [Sphingobacterium arenae]|uniref:Uncharacterized protein n=1 Tax=Sphingobacterium arenae TaxID=1280598 RepID=A0ABR7Y446_9SPHI|nr:hypothetical protein [Sphingobacterium arenae]MBD1426066.1 hypothetical protein [Sphingobacterium arenae]
MINALHIVQEAAQQYKQQFAAESTENLQAVLQHACERTLAEINNLYRQYTEHHLAEHAVQHCHRLLINIHNSLYDERPADTVLLDVSAAMIKQYEISYELYLQHTCTLSHYAENELQEAVLLRLGNVLLVLRQKNIPAVYLAELSSAINSLFTKGKLPELKFSHRHYLFMFLTALEEMARDERKKDWTTRFLHILINYNFNHMGILNRWREGQEEIFAKTDSYMNKVKMLSQQEDNLHLHIPEPAYTYDPLRPSLATYMQGYIHKKRELIETEMEENPLTDDELILSTLNSDEMTVYFQYAYKANLFRYRTKREAAKAFSTYVKSKTGRRISYKTLEKFDKPALEPAAVVMRRKLKEMLTLLEAEFPL